MLFIGKLELRTWTQNNIRSGHNKKGKCNKSQSCLTGKKKLWLGSGFRSDLEVRDEVVEFFEMEDVYSLKLLLGKWYHLDTCFLPLGKYKLS